MNNSRRTTDLRLDIGPTANTAKRPPWIILASLVLVVASVYWAQTILIPLALSILLTFLLSPLVGALQHIGLGRVPSV